MGNHNSLLGRSHLQSLQIWVLLLSKWHCCWSFLQEWSGLGSLCIWITRRTTLTNTQIAGNYEYRSRVTIQYQLSLERHFTGPLTPTRLMGIMIITSLEELLLYRFQWLRKTAIQFSVIAVLIFVLTNILWYSLQSTVTNTF